MLLTNRTVSHFSYSVADIERAVGYWSSALGAGPFFVLEHMKFDWAKHRGKPCTFDHSAAFGQWGPIAIELQQVHAGTAPATLTELLIPSPSPVVNHVAYITTTPEEDSAQLIADGYELFLHGRFGEVEVRFHDTRPVLGQAIEIHRQSAFLEAFFENVAGAARGWDGRNPLRAWK